MNIKDYSIGAKIVLPQEATATASANPTTQTQPQNQVKVTLPAIYQQNMNGAAPNPLAIPNGIQMPIQTPMVQAAGDFGRNWSDFLTIAHSQPR